MTESAIPRNGPMTTADHLHADEIVRTRRKLKMAKPLNGTKFRPLSPIAKQTLRRLLDGPIPVSQVNPGLAARLRGEGLVIQQEHPSPYKTHLGRTCSHFFITEKGRRICQDHEKAIDETEKLKKDEKK